MPRQDLQALYLRLPAVYQQDAHGVDVSGAMICAFPSMPSGAVASPPEAYKPSMKSFSWSVTIRNVVQVRQRHRVCLKSYVRCGGKEDGSLRR